LAPGEVNYKVEMKGEQEQLRKTEKTQRKRDGERVSREKEFGTVGESEGDIREYSPDTILLFLPLIRFFKLSENVDQFVE